MSERQIVIDMVDRRKHHVAATVTTSKGDSHRIGHLPFEGWFCNCPGSKRCAQIKHVKALVPPMEMS